MYKKQWKWGIAAAITLLFLAACTPPGGESTLSTPERVDEEAAATAVAPTLPTLEAADEETAVPDKVTPTEAVETIPLGKNIMTEDDRPQQLRSLTTSWNTNWNLHNINYDEILSGGPPRDGIPSVDEPTFISSKEASDWLADNEPVIVIDLNDIARAYPLQILTWHEIVNDQIGETPIIVTFCPLCNSALVFDRRVGEQTFEFGTSGLLRNSDLIMYDRTTESLWQQFTGEGIVGEMTGQQLTFLPSSLVSFADFRAAFPDGQVLSRDTGYGEAYARRYGHNPYVGYDTLGRSPFLFDGELDGRLQAVERVVTISFAEGDVAYPYRILGDVHVINDSPFGHDLVVFHKDGTSSALGSEVIAAAEDVGATGMFDPTVKGQKLTFFSEGDGFIDEQTNSTWNILGQATGGSLTGTQLTPDIA
jgi:hypothetical protein